jgi:hypothetical protein
MNAKPIRRSVAQENYVGKTQVHLKPNWVAIDERFNNGCRIGVKHDCCLGRRGANRA